jgi:hypothetical protein
MIRVTKSVPLNGIELTIPDQILGFRMNQSFK